MQVPPRPTARNDAAAVAYLHLALDRRRDRLPDRLATYGLAACLALGACGGQDDHDEDTEDGFVIEDGKADDFLSLTAKEFVVSGTGRVVVEAGQGEARARKTSTIYGSYCVPAMRSCE